MTETSPNHGRSFRLSGLLAVALVVLAAAVSPSVERSAQTTGVSNADRPTLRLEITDRQTGKQTPARFSLIVDGAPFFPEELGSHGLRFVSIHESKKQVYVVTYARGTGPVEVALPAGAKSVTVHAAKGFEYFPASSTHKVTGQQPISAQLELRRWTNQLQSGWAAADEHVHYDRLDRAGDRDWLTMLAGDGLTHAHFMVLKGGKVPGIWARQYAYGKAGEASDRERLIRSGEEYRDSAQGHINLLGLREVIPPISTGGLGQPPVRVNYPPLLDVFRRTRELGGLGGVAHGGSLGRHPTAVIDTVLGGVDFFEIGNSHLYSLDLWYRLMNCGYNLPPAAGTDLPNFPFRDHWQPFLGSMRMYVKTGARRDFESWKQAVKRGEVFVTSGPMISLSVDSAGPGGVVRLPAGGGEVTIAAELSTPIGLRKFEIIQSGKPVTVDVEKAERDGVDRWRIRRRLTIRESCWLAARGEGVPIETMKASLKGNKSSWIMSDTLAHTAVIRVLVGDKPVRSTPDTRELNALLRKQQEYYRTRGRYDKGDDRLRMLNLFDEAIAKLNARE